MKSVVNQLNLLKKVPENGLCVFTGLVGASSQSTVKFTRAFEPLVPVSRSLYHCDGKFHTELLRSDLSTHLGGEKVGYVIVDGRNSVIGTLCGHKKELVFDWKNIHLPRKHSKGGQSAVRFEHIRQEKRLVFIKKLCEMTNRCFINRESQQPIVKHVVVAGVGHLKKEFVKCHDALDYRIQKIIMKPLYDIPYGGRFGFNSAIEMSKERLSDLSFVHEENILKNLIREVSSQGSEGVTSLVFGLERVLKCLDMKSVKYLICFRDLPYYRMTYIPTKKSSKKENMSKKDGDDGDDEVVVEIVHKRKRKSFVKLERVDKVVEEQLLLDYVVEQQKKLGIQTMEIVGDETNQGKLFTDGFGGIAASLFYPIHIQTLLNEQIQNEGKESVGMFVFAAAADDDDVSSDNSHDDDDDDNPFGDDYISSGESEEEDEEEFSERFNEEFNDDDDNDDNDNEEEEEEEEEGEEEEESKKEDLALFFTGNVDCGKSSTIGRLLFESGLVPEREMNKHIKKAEDLGRDSWYFAYLMDSSIEEKEKGKTIEVARVCIPTEHKNLTILDSPGHSDYVPKMLECVTQVDVGVLLVSSKKNEFLKGMKGQTMEHAVLLKAMGVERLVVVVNKMDAVGWKKSNFDFVQTKMKSFLCSRLNYKKKSVCFCPISGLKGENVGSRLQREHGGGWYDGPSLIEVLDKLEPSYFQKNEESLKELPLKIPILDSFVERRDKLKVVGRVMEGSLCLREELIIYPQKIEAIVEEIRVNDDRKVKKCCCGDNVEILISFPKMPKYHGREVEWGSIIMKKKEVDENMKASSSSRTPLIVKEFEGKMQIIKKDALLISGTELMFHCHTAHEDCEIQVLEKISSSKRKESAGIAGKVGRTGDQLRIKVRLENPVCLNTFDKSKWMGRFVLRDEEKTFGFGMITQCF